MNKPTNKRYAAFTLVEMAIVLVIIGIILAGVMKGRDIVRGAQVKQFSQQFAQKWGTVAQTYYDKTGSFLNDGEINGGDPGAEPDGLMDGNLDTNLNIATLGTLARLNDVGITPCSLIKSKLTQAGVSVLTGLTAPVSCDTGGAGVNLLQTQVEGEYTGTLNVQVDLVGMTFNNRLAAGGNLEPRNCVVLYGVPTDVCIGLDTAIDGTEDGRNGAFVNVATYNSANVMNGAPYGGAGQVQNPGTTINMGGAAHLWPAATTAQAHTAAIILDF